MKKRKTKRRRSSERHGMMNDLEHVTT